MPHYLEYIIVHEMVHLLERNHTDRFVAYMNQFMPPWRLYDELNRGPLAHETWEYWTTLKCFALHDELLAHLS